MFGRRLLVLLLVLAAIGIPAGVLRAACAGNSCLSTGGEARVPFCPLPQDLKADIAAGYREGRSPDVLAVTRTDSVYGGTDDPGSPPWPSQTGASTTAVPIVFAGTGVTRGTTLPDGTQLDQIAPTLSDVIGFKRPFPNVRAGVAVSGVADGEHPRMILEVALKGIGGADLRGAEGAWPYLRSLVRTGAGTLDGNTGSLPLDPAATLTTIGTGGLPSQHGITGTLVLDDEGRVVRAWGPGAPPSIITTLPDDLDEAGTQRSLIGIVATDPADRGLIGGTWYPRHDRDAMALATGEDAVTSARAMLAMGFGRDEVQDILAVVLDGSVASMDTRLRQLVDAARRASGGSVVVAVAGTGAELDPVPASMSSSEIVSRVEAAVPGGGAVVVGAVPGGLFLDQDTLSAEGITGQAVVDALLDVVGPDGRPIMVDAFQGFAVSFARYC